MPCDTLPDVSDVRVAGLNVSRLNAARLPRCDGAERAWWWHVFRRVCRSSFHEPVVTMAGTRPFSLEGAAVTVKSQNQDSSWIPT